MAAVPDTRSEPAAPAVDLADVQGNILRGYRKPAVRHLVMKVLDAARARAWIAATAGPDRRGVPAITDARDWGDQEPPVCFNLGISAAGLRALGVSASTLASFPEAYRQGMAARATKVGDWGPSGPAHWQPWYQDGSAVHVIATLHGDSLDAISTFERAMQASGAAQAFAVLGQNDGEAFDGDTVHFGYRDSISQPRFAGISPPGRYDDQPTAPLGTVLLGHPTALEQLRWTLPHPEVLGRNGAFNAFRVLEQDVAGFEAYLSEAATQLMDHPALAELLPAALLQAGSDRAARHAALRELVAAKFCGRWRNGTPMALSPVDGAPQPPVSDTDFDYADDPQGLRCPIGAHTRRANPRSARIVQRVANHTRRLVRRGIPYGKAYDPTEAVATERGLLGNFLCADLAAQFEAVQYDWINLGLQEPSITGSNDPLLGANQADASVFEMPTTQGPIRLRGFPRFVRTRGGAYTLLPSLSALRWLGTLGG